VMIKIEYTFSVLVAKKRGSRSLGLDATHPVGNKGLLNGHRSHGAQRHDPCT
jgi:hypothetical protein